jgi:hypothetical protein
MVDRPSRPSRHRIVIANPLGCDARLLTPIKPERERVA